MLPANSAVTAPTYQLARAIYNSTVGTPFELQAGTIADGAIIVTFIDVSGHGEHASQATSANRPTVDADALSGRYLAEFDNDQYLDATPTSTDDLHIFLVVRPGSNGSRVVLTRDTSATTTKPAYEILIG